MNGARTVAGWLPAVLLVPAALVGLVRVSAPPDSAEEAMGRVLPLDPGTTWVYEVRDHGRPSGRRVRQVLGRTQLFRDGVRDGVRISSVYDDYPGRGRQSIDTYLGVEGHDLLQYALIAPRGPLDLEPPAPAFRLPARVGRSWRYTGTLGRNTRIESTLEVTDEGDVEVGGRTFSGCTEWTTRQQVPDAPEGAVEVLTEWTCPGIGVVRSHDVYAGDDVDVTEELVAFHGVHDQWSAEPSPDTPPPLGEASAEGLDQARSRSVPDATPTSTLAWTDSRSRPALFAPVSDGRVQVVGELDGLVSAQDLRTGETRWQVGLTPPIVASPALGGGLVYVADGEKNLWALSLRDGSAEWVHRFDDVVSAVPVVGEAAVAVAVEDGSVVALGRTDGTELWSADLAGRATTAPALAGDLLVVGDDSGALTAFDLPSGDQEWSVPLEQGLEQGPAVSGSQVVAVDGEGVLSSFDLDDGAVRWQARGRSFPTTPLAVGSGHVVTVGEGGWVEAYDLDDGARRWSRRIGGLDTEPVVVGDRVVVVTDSGRVEVLGLADGRSLDAWALPRPDDDARLEVRAPVGLVGDSLVISAESTRPYLPATSYAYRLGDDPTPPGVRFRARAVDVPLPPATPAVVDGDDTYTLVLGGALYRTGGEGPELVVDAVTPTVGFAAASGVVVVPRGEEVWGVRGADGERLWSLPTGEAYVESLPAIGGETAFVPIHGAGLTAVGLRDGAPRWLAETPGATGSSTPLPLPGGDVVYAAAGLTRYDGRTGREVWRLGGDLAAGVAYSRLALAGGAVYAVLVTPAPDGTERSELVAVDADTGELRWRRVVAGTPFGIAPAADEETVVVVDAGNRALAFDAVTGVVRWTHQLATAPLAPATVHDGIVVLVERGRPEDLRQRDFRVTAHDAATGAFLAAYQPPVANSVTLPSSGSAPDGRALVPTAGSEGAYVIELEAVRG